MYVSQSIVKLSKNKKAKCVGYKLARKSIRLRRLWKLIFGQKEKSIIDL
jgi:hypothetical protein